MIYQNVCLESFGYTLPDRIVTTAEIEQRLAPLYERLKLPEGRLELMSGIRERRFWPTDMLPSDQSIVSGNKALDEVDFDRSQIGALIHGSVCRDQLEPATACRVHHGLELPRGCVAYDVSNACLGILNGIVQVANMIELGQIRAGLVVGTENGRELVDSTIDALNRDTSLTRKSVKSSIASLTIGSGSAAVLLTDRELSRTGNRLLAAVGRANTDHHELCAGGHQRTSNQGGTADQGSPLLMETDSEQLLEQGLAIGAETFQAFLEEVDWEVGDLDKTVCHQVGIAHRKGMLESLRLDPANDFTTFETLGNTGSVALPLTLALGIEQGWLKPEDQVALLGIGSGINSLMLAVDWQTSPVSTSPGLAGSASGSGA